MRVFHTCIVFFLVLTTSCNDQDLNTKKLESQDYYKIANEAYQDQNLELAKKNYKLAIENNQIDSVYPVGDYYVGLIGVYLFQNKYGDALAELQEFEDSDYFTEDDKLLFSLDVKQSIMLESKEFEKLDSINKIFYKKSIEFKDTISEANALIFRLNIHRIKEEKEEYEDLLNRLIESSILNDLRKADLLNEKGTHDFYSGNYREAIKDYEAFVNFFRATDLSGAKTSLALGYANIAEAYIELKEHKKARIYLDSFYSIDQNHSIDQNQISNNLRNSVFKYELRIASKDSVDDMNVEQIIDAYAAQQDDFYQKRYNKEIQALTEEKIKSESLLKQQQESEIARLKTLTYSSIAVLILIIAIGLVSFILFRSKKEQTIKDLNNQQRLLRAQMNPHFIFNVIGKIQHLLQEKDQNSISYLSKFSRLLRSVLQNSTKDYVLLEDEIEVLSDYLLLQQLRFPNLFEFEMNISELLLDEFVKVPPMLIQPFVENSIEHGFNKLPHKGIIRLEIQPLKEDDLSKVKCTIVDNGIGFDASQKNSESVSLALISDFIKKSTGKELVIESNHKGTRVSFHINTA